MHIPPNRAEAFHRVTDVIHCKWTLAVLDMLSKGSARPSEIQRALPGLTSKVLTDRLRKLEQFGLLDRQTFAQVPPRVEYTLTEQGRSLAKLALEVGEFVDRWTGEYDESSEQHPAHNPLTES